MSLAESRATPSGRKSTSATAAWPRDTAQGHSQGCCSGCGSGTLLSRSGTVKLQLGPGRCQGVMSGLRPCQGAMPGPQHCLGRATPMPMPRKGRWQPLGTLTGPAACPGLAAAHVVPPLTGRTGTQGTDPRALPDPMGGTLGHSPSLCVPWGPQCHLALPKHPPGRPPPAAQGPWGDTAPTQPRAREGRAAGAAAQLPGLPWDVTFLVTLPLPKGHSQLPECIVTSLGSSPPSWGQFLFSRAITTFLSTWPPSGGCWHPPGPAPPRWGQFYLASAIVTFLGRSPPSQGHCHFLERIVTFLGTSPTS